MLYTRSSKCNMQSNIPITNINRSEENNQRKGGAWWSSTGLNEPRKMRSTTTRVINCNINRSSRPTRRFDNEIVCILDGIGIYRDCAYEVQADDCILSNVDFYGLFWRSLLMDFNVIKKKTTKTSRVYFFFLFFTFSYFCLFFTIFCLFLPGFWPNLDVS